MFDSLRIGYLRVVKVLQTDSGKLIYRVKKPDSTCYNSSAYDLVQAMNCGWGLKNASFNNATGVFVVDDDVPREYA